MSLNLTFLDTAGNSIRTPFLVENTWTTIRITSFEDAEVVPGFYISVSTWGLAVDYPADYPPETDYQDLLSYGQLTTDGVNANGGFKVRLPQEDTSILETYVTHNYGSLYSNRIALQSLAPGETVDIQVMLEVPPISEARRFFININIES